MIRFACPHCGRKLILKDEYAGKRGVCPNCKQRLNVPASTPTNLPNTATVAGALLADADGEALDFLAPPQGPNELGRLGTYRVLKLLGAGGMGVVLHAEDLVLKRAVALKVMRAELAKSKDARQRFLREARAMAAIEHRHIVHIYQVAEDRGVPYLAMPFLKGESLEERLRRERQLSVADSVCIGRQIAEGLAAAHKNELIHRDIKPGNIWLEEQDDPRQSRDWVKLLDFGLARADGEDGRTLTKLGTILGTPGYMAPEQARGVKVDSRCDLFSLGAVLYRMLSGALPFKGTDTMSQLMSLAEDTPRPLRELNAEVPPSLADLVTQLLTKDPAGRPSSARAVADALAALEDASAPPHPSSASKRTLTAGERAILEAPTQFVKPAPVVPAPGGRLRSLGWLPLAGGGGLLGLFVLSLFLMQASKTPTTKPFPVQAKATAPFPKSDEEKPDPPSKTPTTKPFPVQAKATAPFPKSEEKKAGPPPENKEKDVPARPERGQPITNSIGMKLAWVPPGKSWLGGGGGKPGTQEFTLAEGLWCGVYPVTQAEWQAVMDNNPSKFDGHPRNPVERVSWDDVQEFLQKLNSRLADGGLTYRLPSESEWEYICRGGPISQAQSAYRFYFARSRTDLTSVPTNDLSSRQANFDGNYPAGSASKGPYLQATCEVGLYLPNPLGIYDLHGNVWEWTSTPRGSSRVIRGGSWFYFAVLCTASVRYWFEPGDRNYFLGFRVLAVPSGAK